MFNELNIIDILTPLDYTVFFLIILLTLSFVIWGHYKKNKTDNEQENFMDLILMGRSLTLPMFIATLVATWYGGIFGVAQIAFEHGIYNFVTQGFFWYLTYLIFAFFIIDKIHNYQAVTLPDLVRKMFGKKSEKLAAVFNIFNLIPIAYTISLGLLIQMLFGIQLPIAIILGVSFVLLYSFIGGLRSVVYSDILQFFIMLSSVIGVFIYSLIIFGIEPLKKLPEHYFSPTSTFSITEVLVWGLIALSTLVDPNFYQRCFAAKSFQVAKKGIILSTLIWLCFDISLTFGAMYAKAQLPEASAQDGYFLYALELLPNGLRGYFLAGISATILSTLDSYIFLAGSTLAFDLVPKKWKGKVFIHHLGVFIIAIISIGVAYIFEGNIKNVWKTLGSISSAALLCPILYGHFSKKKISDNIFFISAIIGAFMTIIWRLSGLKEYYQLDEIYIGVSASLCTILIFQNLKKLSSHLS